MNTTKLIYIFVGIAVVAGLVGVLLPDRVAAPITDDVTETETETDEAVFCTMDAKQCPDGSYVGRTGPNCEFTACPAVSDDQSEMQDMIVVAEPIENDLVTSPLQLSGEARGYWFFEATAPVQVLSLSGDVLGESWVTAQGTWMTESFVPFTGEVSFDPGQETQGYVVFRKQNASGLPENDAEILIPVQFAQ